MKIRYRIAYILGLCLCAGGYGAIGAQGQTASPQVGQSDSPSAAKPQPVKPRPDAPSASKKKSKGKQEPSTDASVEPDKVLYDRAVYDIKRSRYTEGRLAYQTLINTYPDSEYLAKAKLGVADSYYKEGGTSNFTQAVSEYKDFITFFPFLDEAAYAQLQVGMAYYRMMEKADRDKTQAEQAEDALQTFILKYPQSPLRPRAEQQLRNVQEILADGQYKTARFYYLKQDYRPAAARLFELTERYPLYSQSDSALWMLGDVYFRAKALSKSEDDKNHWADLATQCYDRLIQNYPGSKLVPEAKARLKAMDQKIPAADPNAVAMMQQEQLYDKQHAHHSRLHMPMRGSMLGMVTGTPDFSAAAHFGVPTLLPPDDSVSALEVLKPGASGPDFTLSARQITSPDEAAPSATGEVGIATSAGPPSDVASGAGVQATIIDQGSGAADPAAPPSDSTGSSSGTLPTPLTPDANSSSSGAGSSDPGSGALPPPLTPTTPTSVAPQDNSTNATPAPAPAESNSVTSTPVATTGTTATQQEAPQAEPTKADKSTESTSKKKKGVHKLNPF